MMRKSVLRMQLLPKDKKWLKLFVMAEALGPPPSVMHHQKHFDKRSRVGRQPEETKL